MAVKIYDPDNVACSFAGIPLQGFADGEFIRLEQPEDSFTTKVGADGEVTRTKTSGGSLSRVSLKLMQTSDTNDLLSAIHLLDLAEHNGSGVAPFQIADLSGRMLFIAPESWIIKPPDASYDKEATEREWNFDCADAIRFDGGN